MPVISALRKLKQRLTPSLRYRDGAKGKAGSDMVVHVFHTNTQEQEQEDLCEFKTKLVYIVSSRPARLHSNTLSQNNNKIGLGL